MTAFPPAVREALERLEAAGFSACAVGGCVRDSLLGQTPADWDIASSARPEEVKRVFADCRVLPTGERHGTVTAVLDGMPLEITAFRTEGPYSDGRRPDRVSFANSIEEDLSRRDFTVNAMAAAPDGQLRDPFGGRADLEAGVIRCVGEPAERFSEDALRILRALRFAAVLGFSIHPETAAAIRSQRGLLVRVSAERVWEELKKLLCGRDVLPMLLDFPEVFSQLIPELGPTVGFEQHTPYHLYDVYAHTARAAAAVPPDPELRLAMLLHDIGKPARFFRGPDGAGHFKGHPAAGADMAENILRRMKLPGKTVRRILPLIRYHDAAIRPEELRLWLSRLGEAGFADLLAVKRADNLAQHLEASDRREEYDRLEARAAEILRRGDCLTLRQLAVSGEDLREAGFSGPDIGRMLRELLFRVLKGGCPNDKSALLALAGTLKLPKPLRLGPHPSFCFRRAGESDAKAAGELYHAVTESIARELDPPCKGWRTGEYPTPETAREAWARGELFVLLADGEVVGAAVLNRRQPEAYRQADWAFSGSIWVLHTFAVHPDCRGHRAGRRMLDACEEWARAAGGDAVRLDTLAFNQPAIRLYEGAGFRYAGTIDLGLGIPGAKWFRTYEKRLSGGQKKDF